MTRGVRISKKPEDRVAACHYANEVSQGNPRNMT